ncbi:MAG: GNAT family N-acetyltransferase [Gaiellales bacterium]
MIEPVGADDIDRLEPLWLILHAHHQATARELAPYVDDGASWTARRALYFELLAGGGFGFVARCAGVELGYAFVGREHAAWPATFVEAPAAAELETLLVRPEARGRGLGAALLAAVDDEAATRGLHEARVGVMPQNARATALYERNGYVPTWLIQTRFGWRGTPSPPAEPIADVAAEELDALKPLWLALHRHHQDVAPQLGPYLDDERSWEAIRAILGANLERGLVLRAGPAHDPSGFTCVTIARDDVLWADTWVTSRDVAEVALLSVAPDARGQGIGTALLDAVDCRLAVLGIADQAIGAIEQNARPIALYASRAFRPTWLRLRRTASPAS